MPRPHDLETVTEPAPGEEMDEMAASLSAAVNANPDPRAGEPEGGLEPEPDPETEPTPKPKDPPKPKAEDDDEDPPAVVVKPKAGEKPADPPKPKAGEKPTEPKPEEPLTVEQIRALKPGRGASKDDVTGFRTLREIAAKATDRATALQKEVEGLKGNADTAPALATKVQEQEAKIAELQKYEYLVNPEASYIVRAKYDTQITQTEDQILHYLKEGGMKDTVLQQIKEQGRLLKYSKDAWLGAPEWKNLKPYAQKKAQDAVVKYFDLQEERAKEIEKAATDRTGYEETVKAKAQEQVAKNVEEYEDEIGKIQKELPGWARLIDETNLKGDELKTAQAHNKYLSETLEPMFAKAANPQSVREVARNAAKIVQLHQLEIEHAETVKENERLTTELEAANAKLAQRKAMGRIPGGPTGGAPKKPAGSLGSTGAPKGDEDDMKSNMDIAMGRKPE